MADRQFRRSKLRCGVLLALAYATVGWCAVPDATVLQIQGEIQTGQVDKAERDVDAELKHNPQDGGLYNLRGIIHAKRDQIDAAKDDFARAIRLSPRLTGAYLNFGRACELHAANHPAELDDAIVQYRRLLKLEPAAQQVRIQAAKLLEARANYSAALAELDRLTKAEGASGLATLLRCAALVGLHRERDAEALAKNLAGNPDLDGDSLEAVFPILQKNDAVVIAALCAISQRQELSTMNLQRLAVAYERTRQWSEARRTGEKIAAASVNDTAPLLDLARMAQEQGDFQGALGYLAHARDLNPNSATIHFFFGVVCIELNLPLEAKKSLDKALSWDPDNAIYNYARGSVELQGRSGWQAIPYFKRFIAAQPNDERGHFALGVAEFASEEYDASKQEMNLAVRSPKTSAGAEYFLGRIAKVESDWKNAAEHFGKSIQADPNYAESHAEFGLAQMHLGNLAAARKELDRALALKPDSYFANSNLLVFLRSTKDPRADSQQAKLHQLDANRWERQELLIRTIKIDPYAH